MPKTLDELRELSGKLTTWEGDTAKLVGATPWAGSWAWPSMFASNGGGVWDGEKYSINHPKNVELVQYWIDWIAREYKDNIDNLRAQGDFTSCLEGTGFQLGVQAIGIDGVWSLTHIPPEIKYELTKLPIGPGGTKSATSNWPNLMFIPKGAKHPVEAFEAIAYFATQGMYEWWDHYSDVPYWKKFPRDRAPRDLVARVGKERALELTSFSWECLPEVVLQWNSPVEDLATDEIYRAVDQALHKAVDPKAALDQAQTAVTAKLDEVMSTVS